MEIKVEPPRMFVVCFLLLEILTIYTINFHLINSLKQARGKSFQNSEKIIAFIFFTPTILCSMYFSISLFNKKVKTRLFRCRYLRSLKLSTMCSCQSILFKQCEYFLNKIDWTIVFIHQNLISRSEQAITKIKWYRPVNLGLDLT